MDADILTPELTTTAHCWSSHCLVHVGMARHHCTFPRNRYSFGNTLSFKVMLGPIFKLLGQLMKEWRLFSQLHSTPLLRNNWRVLN